MNSNPDIEKTPPPHRGANGDMRAFAQAFVHGRIEGFSKDMTICLRGFPSRTRDGDTHAYFPALMSCCGTIEYLTQLYLGRTDACSDKETTLYAAAFLPASYTEDVMRVLHYAFRHPIAHRGIASGVWVDEDRRREERRVTWTIDETDRDPAFEIVHSPGTITQDSPWDCPYTHRVFIGVGRLWKDIRESAIGERGYCAALTKDDKLVKNFRTCMNEMYPVASTRR